MSALTPAHQAPQRGDRNWNQYRARVIAAIFDAEYSFSLRGYNVSDDTMTGEVAPLLGLSVDTLDDYQALHYVVRNVRYVAREQLRMVAQQQGGQFQLALF